MALVRDQFIAADLDLLRRLNPHADMPVTLHPVHVDGDAIAQQQREKLVGVDAGVDGEADALAFTASDCQKSHGEIHFRLGGVRPT